MGQLESRPLKYFLTVAEELHFGRAADRLGIAPPPLSRAIRQLENELGVSLLHRTSRRVSLTPAGEALLEHGHVAIAALTTAANEARIAGDATELLVAVGVEVDLRLISAVREACAQQSGGAVRLVPSVCVSAEETARMLRDGRADVGLLHAPLFDDTGLDVQTVGCERRVVALPASHRLGCREEVSFSDLLGEPFPGGLDEDARWLAGEDDESLTLRGSTRRRTLRRARSFQGTSQMLSMVELGQLVVFLPATMASRNVRPGIAYVPVADVSPIRLAVAWPDGSRSVAVANFVRAAEAVMAPAPALA
jgi:DNA-binding transcriptional LysR family regulator